MVNRVTRGRTREAADAYGCALRCPDRALAVWAHDGLARRVTHRATTSGRGASSPAGAAQAMTMTHGDANAHRPDVNPAV